MDQKIMEAVKEYNRRKNGGFLPGYTDKAGRFYSEPSDVCECCKSIRTPTTAWPFSILHHCKTAKHIATLYGIEEKELKGKRLKANMLIIKMLEG